MCFSTIFQQGVFKRAIKEIKYAIRPNRIVAMQIQPDAVIMSLLHYTDAQHVLGATISNQYLCIKQHMSVWR